MPDTLCPVCSNALNTSPRVSEKAYASINDCPQCGQYVLGDLAQLSQEFRDSKQLISAWLRLQNKRGNNRFFIEDEFTSHDWFKNLHNMGFPQTVNEKLDALLKTYADIAKDDYNCIVGVENHLELVSDIAAKNMNEITGLNRLLAELEYTNSKDGRLDRVRISAKGWQRIDDLSKSILTNDSAFIAMWFDPQTNDCREAIREAVTACGYKPVIVDDTEFNDFIMNEVVTLIRQAHFLIADLTCKPEEVNANNSQVTGGVRGGVYWEAGMAYGMGKTVIQTCKEADCSINRIHFDLNQYSTIRWKDDNLTTGHIELYDHVDNPSFAQELARRIMFTVGKGSYTSTSE